MTARVRLQIGQLRERLVAAGHLRHCYFVHKEKQIYSTNLALVRFLACVRA